MDWLQIQGRSMLPLLSPGDFVGIQWIHGDPGPKSFPVLGEIILTQSPEKDWVVHRVIDLKPEAPQHFWIKGDSAFAAEKVLGHQIWGKVVAIRSSDSPRIIPIKINALDGTIARVSRWTRLDNSNPQPSLLSLLQRGRRGVLRRLLLLLALLRRHRLCRTRPL